MSKPANFTVYRDVFLGCHFLVVKDPLGRMCLQWSTSKPLSSMFYKDAWSLCPGHGCDREYVYAYLHICLLQKGGFHIFSAISPIKRVVTYQSKEIPSVYAACNGDQRNAVCVIWMRIAGGMDVHGFGE